ncbi:MAG: glycosyltransferase family 4 protein [Magnetococcales bacterium]|nr:glycosyltransferase family 4 protein [Magnetococcales bacterium]
MSHELREPFHKPLLRGAYSAALGVHGLLTLPWRGSREEPRLFYGGARSGDVGGTLVKIQRLRQIFPEHRWSYNLVYALSNSPYLPGMALSLLKLRGIPMVHNQNGVFYPGWYSGDWQGRNRRMARTYLQADHVFYQSDFCRRAAERFLGRREGPGEILFNGVDTGFYRPRPEFTQPRSPYVFLLTGKIDAHLAYRVETTMRGLAKARRQGLEARLIVAGWVEPQSLLALLALAEELKIADHVRFTGPYRQDQAPEIYQQADAYVMTKHNDPCPNTVMEALACGLPVVHVQSGGAPEQVGEAGIGVATGGEDWERILIPEAGALGRAMMTAAEHHAAWSEAARRRAVERFDLAHWIRRHHEVFQYLLQRADG